MKNNFLPLEMIQIWRPWKLFNSQDPPPLLSIHAKNSSTPFTLGVQFQANSTPPPLLQTITNKLKENSKYDYYMLSGPSLRSAFVFIIIPLILPDFPLTSFHLTTALLSAFSWLYSFVCAFVQKIPQMPFIYVY